MDTLLEMEKQGTISTQGLSESQSNTVRALINAYHIKNAQTVKQITKEQFSNLQKTIRIENQEIEIKTDFV